MFPQPAVRFDVLKPRFPTLRFWRIPDQNIVARRAFLKCLGQRRTARFGDVHKYVLSCPGNDH